MEDRLGPGGGRGGGRRIYLSERTWVSSSPSILPCSPQQPFALCSVPRCHPSPLLCQAARRPRPFLLCTRRASSSITSLVVALRRLERV